MFASFIILFRTKKSVATLILFLGGFMVSCATYQKKVDIARKHLLKGEPQEAVSKLKPLAMKPGDDQLVYLLDYGIALQMAGDYKTSNQVFLQADKIAEVKDYHSLSRIAGSLAFNEGMVQYKGEDYEKILINAYLALNYLMLGLHEDALVEAKRLNEKLYKYKFEAKKDYEQNPFARYLAAMIWEDDQKWDDAYIEYKQVYELNPQFINIGEDLIRTAQKAQRLDELKKWKNEFKNITHKAEWSSNEYGELVIIYQQGWGPRKRPHPESPRFPKLYSVSSHTKKINVEIENEKGSLQIPSQLIYNVESVAIKTLDDAYSALVAKRMAGIATKAVLADQIRQKNETLGNLAWIAMNIADQADLRQWSTLPESFQICRVFIKADNYRMNIKGLNLSGIPTGENLENALITIRPKHKTFFLWRSLQ